MKVSSETINDILKFTFHYPDSCSITKVHTRKYELLNGGVQDMNEYYITNRQGLPKECFYLSKGGWDLVEDWNQIDKTVMVSLYKNQEREEAVEILWSENELIVTISPIQLPYRTIEDASVSQVRDLKTQYPTFYIDLTTSSLNEFLADEFMFPDMLTDEFKKWLNKNKDEEEGK